MFSAHRSPGSVRHPIRASSYDPEGRRVMEFELDPKMTADPEKGARELVNGSP